MTEVDARGLSCPEPVILTKKGIRDKPKEIKVYVDNNVSRENVSKFLRREGYSLQITEENEAMVIHGKK